MSKKSCQTDAFVFGSACGDCPRCGAEATSVVLKWRTSPMCEIPQHIVIALLQAEAILGTKQFVDLVRGTNGKAD